MKAMSRRDALRWFGGSALATTTGCAAAEREREDVGVEAARATDARSVVPLPRGGRCYFGVRVPPSGGERADVSATERQLGRTLDIHVVSIAKFDNAWPLAYLRDTAQLWSMNWHPRADDGGPILQQIVRGGFDDVIRRRAREVRGLRAFLLRYGHEMNGGWYPWGQKPWLYKASWRHIYRLFREEGADNVAFTWAPGAGADGRDSGQSGGASNFEEYYPGDDVVDWIAVDGYNVNRRRDKTFADVFGRWYEVYAPHDKPMIVTELGCNENADRPDSKARWVDATRTALKRDFPKVRGIIYSNYADSNNDWSIDTSPSSLEAFRQLARDPYFNA